MGIFLHTVLFPGGDELKCRTALQRAAQEPDFSLHLDGCRWHLFDKGPAALLTAAAAMRIWPSACPPPSPAR